MKVNTTKPESTNDPAAVGARLREERTRLRLSQKALAALAQVHVNTQSRYELGVRELDAGYVDAARRAGVDIAYVLTGARSDDRASFQFAAERLVRELARRARLDGAAVVAILGLVGDCYAVIPPDDDSGAHHVPEVVFDLLDALEEDGPTLAKSFQTVDEVEKALRNRLPGDKLGRIVLMTYRAFRSGTGPVDHMIADAVILAS